MVPEHVEFEMVKIAGECHTKFVVVEYHANTYLLFCFVTLGYIYI